jgi:hypothetical protein
MPIGADPRPAVHDVSGRHDADDVVRAAVHFHDLAMMGRPPWRTAAVRAKDRHWRAAEAGLEDIASVLASGEGRPCSAARRGSGKVIVDQRGARSGRTGREVDRTRPATRTSRRVAFADGEGADLGERMGHRPELDARGSRA